MTGYASRSSWIARFCSFFSTSQEKIRLYLLGIWMFPWNSLPRLIGLLHICIQIQVSSSPPMILHINHSIKKKNVPPRICGFSPHFYFNGVWTAETIIQHCFESIVFSRCFQAFVGTPLDSDTDYLPLKDTSVNPARLLFSLKWTEYLITLIYRILLSKAARYLAVTGSLINIIIRIFTPLALSRVFFFLLFSAGNQTQKQIFEVKGRDTYREILWIYWRNLWGVIDAFKPPEITHKPTLMH